MGTKSKTNGHVQRSTSEWQTIMKRFSQSGRSRAAFCRAEGISPSTFDVWHRKLRQVKAPATKPPAEFVELTPVEATAIGGWAIETELPDGTVARFWG